MAGKPLGDQHRALLCQGKEDEMEVFGYKAQGLREALCVAGYVLSCGALWLVFYWKPEWGVWATCRPCHLEDADTVLLRTTDEFRGCIRKKVVLLDLSKVLEEEQLDQDFRTDNGCIIRRAVRKPDWKVRYIQVQKIRYVWDVLGQEFVRVGSLEDSNTCHDIHQKFGDGLTRKEKEVRKLVCGPNTIEIEIRPVWNLLFKEVLNPFYLFQGFTLTLWLSQGYYEYASAILILTFITIAVTVYDLRQQSVKLHNLVEEHNKVEVTAWTKQEGAQKMESCHLVPGDVLLLEGQKFSLPCDAILLEGSCVVNEGMLTGESVPVTKTALPHADQATPWKRHSSEDYRRHVLFCGTEIIQTRRAGKGPARAIVLQTGFNTAKGDLVRSILYPKPLNFKLHREAFKFILCLLAIGIVGLVYAACVYAAHKEPVADTVVMALLLLTTAVPPALPVALTTGTAYAQRRLKAKRIFCISPQRINICGHINLVCFDKTGTLTEDGLNLWGVIPCQKRSFQNAHTFSASCPLPWGPLCAAMATCHSLLLLEGKIQGDPLDLEMFQGTRWDHGITVEGSSGSSNFHFALSGTSYQVIKKHFSSFLPKILINATVFARMSPGQKSSLVEEFQKLDYCVGMCGDGANDCGALKVAHAGISLSEQEASVASPFTSQTPNIECVPELIREGRAALVSSFAVFKYITLYALQAFMATALLYWQIQIMGNYQYLVLDGISLAAMITMSLSRACPKLAPYRPPARLLSPPLMFSVALSVGFSLAVQTVGFLLVKQQPWYAQVRSYRGCPSGNQPLLPANGTANATAEEHRVLGYEDTTLFYLTTFDVVMVAFVFSQGRPFRKPIYTNYLFSCLLCLQLGVCFFLLFTDLEAVYRGLELLCTPVLWRVNVLVMLLVKFLVSFFVEDALLQNYGLWLWLKALFRYRPSSHYRRLQRQLEGDASWPPVGRRDLLVTQVKSEAYLNPVYEHHGEEEEEEEEEVPGGKQPRRGLSDAQAGI
ncbi:hypothetical protein JRQ81_017636 [Phrynocephalus forsythii]|uniref:Cation-transporting ATPase n=1 Tax=Phrynocephalus forsythii TaxID=171643 RepID=A0A9Q0XQR9_9SAUR|nr:hypothetical protein JRQ81_017636 [Phrynocephalus forsythii]